MQIYPYAFAKTNLVILYIPREGSLLLHPVYTKDEAIVVWRNVYRYFVETSASDEEWLSDFAGDEKKFSTSSEDPWSLRRKNLPSHALILRLLFLIHRHVCGFFLVNGRRWSGLQRLMLLPYRLLLDKRLLWAIPQQMLTAPTPIACVRSPVSWSFNRRRLRHGRAWCRRRCCRSFLQCLLEIAYSFLHISSIVILSLIHI